VWVAFYFVALSITFSSIKDSVNLSFVGINHLIQIVLHFLSVFLLVTKSSNKWFSEVREIEKRLKEFTIF